MKKLRKNLGFNLIEVMVSLSILTIAIFALVASLLYANSNNKSIENRIIALNAANTLLIYTPDKLPSYTGDANITDLDAPPFSSNLFTNAQLKKLKRKITITTYDPTDAKFSNYKTIKIEIRYPVNSTTYKSITLNKIIH